MTSLITQHNSDLGDVFYDTTSGFAITATHVTSGGTFPVIPDSPYLELEGGGVVPVHGRDITLRAKKSDIDSNSIAKGDAVTFSLDGSDQTLDIAEIEPNGFLEVFLIMRRQ